jgi:hypothetical protein
MESCLTKSIMSGAAGFVLGGAFGLFMSSVRLFMEARSLNHQLTLEITDGIRYSPHSSRPSPHLPTSQRTTTARLKRYGIQVLLLSQEFCNDRCHVQRYRVLHRRPTSQKRFNKQRCRWMHHRRSSGIQSWTSGCAFGMWRLRSFLSGHRCLYAYAGRLRDDTLMTDKYYTVFELSILASEHCKVSATREKSLDSVFVRY